MKLSFVVEKVNMLDILSFSYIAGRTVASKWSILCPFVFTNDCLIWQAYPIYLFYAVSYLNTPKYYINHTCQIKQYFVWCTCLERECPYVGYVVELGIEYVS